MDNCGRPSGYDSTDTGLLLSQAGELEGAMVSAGGEDDELLLCDDPETVAAEPWTVLIVDDEPAVHEVSTMVLAGLRFRDRGLRFLSAYDSHEARRLLAEHEDIAVVLLDVVMETEDAGLQLVRHIRNELANHCTRIILRTGQPGQAPERQVILEYDINDYKEKTELTAQKLSTAVVAALRGYLALKEVANLNRELEGRVASRTCELQLAHDRLKRSLESIEQGERAGRHVQFKLLPSSDWRVGRYEFAHCLMPSQFMSGDFVDYFHIDADRVAFYIADVSGHGVASAFVTVYLKRFMSTALDAQHTQAEALIKDPARLLDQLNRDLLRDKVGKHIAIFYAVLELATGRLRCANGGAYPYPVYADVGGQRFLEAKSTPVGLFESAHYENFELTLAGRSRLLMCSDGVLEVLPEAGSEARLDHLRLSAALEHESFAQIRTALGLNQVTQLPDDLTLLLIEASSSHGQ